MQRLIQRTVIRAAAVALALCGAAAAQAQQVKFTGPYIGMAIGDTDLDTAFRFFGGGQFTNIFGIEGQVATYGSRTYQQGLFTYKDSAWAAGVYGTATMPVAQNFSVFGKLGVHYFRMKHDAPNGSTQDSSAELGIGVGLKWQFVPQAALRADFENIGGSGGDIISVGIQFPLNF